LRALAAAARSPVASARVGVWAWTQSRRLRSSLLDHGIDAIDAIHPSPAVAARHRTAVAAVMKRTGASCLVRSALLQRWDADHGVPRPLVVGVARDSEAGVSAHAWLEGERHADFEELLRRPPPKVAGRSGAGNALS
jgi:Transglutaminase-like superfamily